MLLSTDREAIETSGLEQTSSFSIAASAKAFEVLSSNLYQNKILAVIREISCNAADAHALVGAPLSSIEVHIPTIMEPVFSVRDFGPGLSRADVMELYTTYFRSTKDQSNDLIGGFGLGSKSPFAVADQFTVTSWHDWQQSEYICFKENGLPRVSLVRSEPSPEPSGLRVQVAARNMSEWAHQAAKFYSWWPEFPTFTGNTLDLQHPLTDVQLQSETMLNGLPTWASFKSQVAPVVFMGLVPYGLNFDNLTGLPREVYTLLKSGSLFINFPVGSLSISPSRESLSYDPATIKALTDRCCTVAKAIINQAITVLDEEPTLYHARKFVFKSGNFNTVSKAVMDLASKGKIKWRGHEIPLNVELDLPVDFPSGNACIRTYEKRSSWKNFQKGVTWNGQVSLGKGSLWDDGAFEIVWASKIGSKTYSTLRYNYLPPSHHQSDINVYLFIGMDYQFLVDYCLAKGLPEPTNINDLEEPPKAERGTSSSVPKTMGYIYDDRYDSSRTTAPLDLKGGGVYITFKEGAALCSDNHRDVLRIIDKQKLVASMPRVIGLSHKALKTKKFQAALAANGWQEFTPAWVAANVLPDRLYQVSLLNQIGRFLFVNRPFNPRKLREAIAHGPGYWKHGDKFIKMLEPHRDMLSIDTFVLHHDAPNPLLSWASPDHKALIDKAVGHVQLLSVEWGKFLAAHPMLQHVDLASVPSSVLDSYINR